MRQTRDESRQNLAERRCWEVARRDDRRLARRLYRKQVVDGVYRLDEGALLEDVFHDLEEVGVMAWLADIHGTAMHRERVPFVPYGLRYGLKPLCGMERMPAWPALWCSAEALMPLVGFNAQQGRQGVGQRGATQRQGERAPGPSGPDTLAQQIVQRKARDLEAVCTGAIRAVARAGGFGEKVTGMADGPDLETTARDQGGGQVTRKGRLEDTQGRAHELEVTLYGWKGLLLIEAVTTIPLAVKVGQLDAHEPHWTRALVTQARAPLAGAAGLHKLVCDRGFGDGTELGWLDQQGSLCGVPAQTTRAVTVEARAPAAAGEGLSHGRRV
jgi:hypothetical protein